MRFIVQGMIQREKELGVGMGHCGDSILEVIHIIV